MMTKTVSFRLEDARGHRPLILLIAPSEKSPAFESQLELIEQDEVVGRLNASLVLVLSEGTSTIDGERLDDSSVDALITAFSDSEHPFLIVLIGQDGQELHRDDAPLQTGAIIERLSDAPPGDTPMA